MSSKGDRVEETQCAEEVNSSCGGVNLQARDLLSRSDNYSNEGLDPLGCGEGTLHIPSDEEDIRNEPEDSNDRSGTARTSTADIDIDGGGDGGGIVNVERSIEQFENIKAQELKPRTCKEYVYVFKSFARYINLGRKTKRDLRERGRKYILQYIRKGIPKSSWKKARAGLQAFWEDVFELEWPIRRSDIKIKYKVGRGYTPSDSVILEWAKAMKHDRDPYIRLIWLLIVQHGWRPSHVRGIRWKHVHRDKDDNPIYIVCHPENGEFKTDQPVAVHLAPDVVEALKEWEKENDRKGPEDHILPWRSRAIAEEIVWDRSLDNFQILRIFQDLYKRNRLPKLTPRDCRHWVSTACRKAGLSKAATAYLQGHDSSGGSTMRDWYDHISEHDAIAEQVQIIPNGPLGTLLQPDIKIDGDIPIEAQDLINSFLKGKLGSIEVMTELENIKRKMTEADVLKP